MKIKRDLVLLRAGMLENLQFRLSTFFTLIGNLLYLLLVYYLWKAIFASSDSDVVNSMTFNGTMIYLVFASALFQFMETYIVWFMGRDIQSGKIVVDLLKPMNYRTYMFFSNSGAMVMNFFTTFLPTAIICFIIAKGEIPIGINLFWFVISVLLSVLINYYINFFVGVICMYTQSNWGINIMKEVIVGLLSGAVVPLAFFPETLRNIAMYLPFHCVINSPMKMLLTKDADCSVVTDTLGMQLLWVVLLLIISELFFRTSLKKITVNGG